MWSHPDKVTNRVSCKYRPKQGSCGWSISVLWNIGLQTIQWTFQAPRWNAGSQGRAIGPPLPWLRSEWCNIPFITPGGARPPKDTIQYTDKPYMTTLTRTRYSMSRASSVLHVFELCTSCIHTRWVYTKIVNVEQEFPERRSVECFGKTVSNPRFWPRPKVTVRISLACPPLAS